MVNTLKQRESREESILLEMFYQKYSNKLLNYSFGFLKSKEETEEAVQDIFVKFWNKKHHIQEIDAYEPYLFKIAKHHLLNLLRKKAENNMIAFDSQKHSQKVRSVEHQIIFEEQFQSAKEVIDNFPPKRKLVYDYKRNEGLTNKQIADKMNISTTMVEKHWKIAVTTLKEHIKNSAMWLICTSLIFL